MAFKHILVPHDGSPLSQESARKAVQLAKDIGAKITAFYVKPTYMDSPLGESSISQPMTSEKFDDLVAKEARQILSYVEILCKQEGVVCDCQTVSSDYPADAIVQAAKEYEVDLIWMASNRRKGIQNLLIGSETRKVMTYSGIPTLVFRQSEDGC